MEDNEYVKFTKSDIRKLIDAFEKLHTVVINDSWLNEDKSVRAAIEMLENKL